MSYDLKFSVCPKCHSHNWMATADGAACLNCDWKFVGNIYVNEKTNNIIMDKKKELKMNQPEIVRYELCNDEKGLMGVLATGHTFHVHSDELSELEKWILRQMLMVKDWNISKGGK